MTIFERTKQLAKEKGYSLAKVERMAGLSENYLYTWKKTDSPRKSSIEAVAKVLQVSPEYLQTGQGTVSLDTFSSKVSHAIATSFFVQMAALDNEHKQRVYAYTEAQFEDQLRQQKESEILAAHQANDGHNIDDNEAKEIGKYLDDRINELNDDK